MSNGDPTLREKHRLRAQRVDPARPLGISEPQHPGDCGWDLTAMKATRIRPGHSVDVPVNCRLQLPEHYWAQILARSSINKLGLHVECGVIDNGYRGPVFVVLRNVQRPSYVVGADETNRAQDIEDVKRGKPHLVNVYAEDKVNDIWVQEGQRVGQLVLHRLAPAWLSEEPVATDTARGEDGFGSTGTGLETLAAPLVTRLSDGNGRTRQDS